MKIKYKLMWTEGRLQNKSMGKILEGVVASTTLGNTLIELQLFVWVLLHVKQV